MIATRVGLRGPGSRMVDKLADDAADRLFSLGPELPIEAVEQPVPHALSRRVAGNRKTRVGP